MNNRHPAALILFASILMLVHGCGQKGALYLPDEAEQQERRPVVERQAN
ncbi:MAG: lipoprotein [Thiohalobacterales bacterium]|nr:lipoprotein [Thiohalobacterales bacterium]